MKPDFQQNQCLRTKLKKKIIVKKGSKKYRMSNWINLSNP